MAAHRERATPVRRTIWLGRLVPLLAAVLLLGVPAGLILPRAPASPLPDLVMPQARLLEEIGKQAIEQPLHFIVAAAPVCLSRSLVGVPWYGWAIAPLLGYREWSQWPSRRWWDPPLDWAFMALGLAVATWRRGRRHPIAGPPGDQRSPRSPSHPLRRKYPSSPPATASIRASASG